MQHLQQEGVNCGDRIEDALAPVMSQLAAELPNQSGFEMLSDAGLDLPDCRKDTSDHSWASVRTEVVRKSMFLGGPHLREDQSHTLAYSTFVLSQRYA